MDNLNFGPLRFRYLLVNRNDLPIKCLVQLISDAKKREKPTSNDQHSRELEILAYLSFVLLQRMRFPIFVKIVMDIHIHVITIFPTF